MIYTDIEIKHLKTPANGYILIITYKFAFYIISYIICDIIIYSYYIIIIIIIIKIESAVKGRERVRTLYQSEDPNSTQITHGRKKIENSRRQNERAD